VRAGALALAALLAADAAAAQGLEYSIEKKIGYPLDWPDGTTVFFHELPFMSGRDFARAVVIKTRNANAPGTFDVEIRHSATGSTKFRAVADADRERSFCVIFRNTVRTCSGFAPAVKDIFNGSIIHGFSKADAEKLAGEINAMLK